jgi:subtilisin family serine protease
LTLLTSAVFAQEKDKIVRAGSDKIENEYIVVLEDDVLPEQVSELSRQAAGALDLRAEKVWQHAIKGFFVRMSEAQAEALSQNPNVKYIEENAQWYLSATHPTNINPVTCDPTVSNCPAVVDNRLWHLDRADQNRASPTNQYSYTTNGTGVTVYVVDTGVNRFHQEFANSARIRPGFNATPDLMPADDPCMGFALPANHFYEQGLYDSEVLGGGHGTAVASALGGTRTGIAKNVTIVPIKVAPCDRLSGRERINSHLYQQNETMYRSPNNGLNSGVLYRAQNTGTSANSDPGSWPVGDNQTILDGQIIWKVIPVDNTANINTQFLINGLDWILSSANPGPKSHAVVTLSTYRVATEALVAGPSNSVEQSIRNLLANNITVIASANNQNGNACHTSPARLSANNPDTIIANNVITVGGSMIINRPWTVDISDVPGGIVADGPTSVFTSYGPELDYDPTKPVRDGRWICGRGDSSRLCSNATATASPNPINVSNYVNFQGGSNAGPCVTLFAPAKNMFVASPASASAYRDARLRGGYASGTSFSAPIVAGFAARLLQATPSLTPVDVRTALLNNSAATLDAGSLDTVAHNGAPITGTPNKMLQLGDVNITSHPVSGTGPVTLSVTASGTSTLTYQWYEVNAGFDLANYNYGAHSSTPIGGATSSTLNAPVSPVTKAYWVRVTNAGGSADSNIATIEPGVCDAATIVQQPQNQTIAPGQTATLTVVAGGTAPRTFQWFEGPSGTTTTPVCANSASCAVAPLTTKQYWVRVQNACGPPVNSTAATVTVQCTAAPTITAQPTSRTTNPGQSTTLSVTATQAASYQWYQGTAPSTTTPVGTNSPTLTVAPTSTTSYWVRITNACGFADSATATVCVLPSITAQPTSRTINPGQSTTFTVTAPNATSYQWYQGTAPSTTTPVGTNSNSLTVTPAVTTSYWVRVTNACGFINSTTATVTLQTPGITRIQSAFSLANSQTSITANWPQPTQAGTFLVAVISGVMDPVPYINYTAPAGWTEAVRSEWNNIKLAVYYRPNNPGARTSETFTVSPGFHDMTLYILEYSGIVAVSPLDRTAIVGNSSNSGSVQTGFTQNTTQAKELVITALSTYTQTQFSTFPTDGYTEVYDKFVMFDLTTATYEKIVNAIGSYGHSASVGGNEQWVGLVATFRGTP